MENRARTTFDLHRAQTDNGRTPTGRDRKDDMASVEKIDDRIESYQALIEKLREQRKAAAAKERQQTRKWRSAYLAAVGETVTRSAGCDWAELDLEALQEALSDIGSELLSGSVVAGRSPAEAKRALDAFKRSRREGKTDATDDVGGAKAAEETELTGEAQPTEDDGTSQTRPW